MLLLVSCISYTQHNSTAAFLLSVSVVRFFFSFDTHFCVKIITASFTIIGLYFWKKEKLFLNVLFVRIEAFFASKLTIFQSCGDIFLAGTSTNLAIKGLVL